MKFLLKRSDGKEWRANSLTKLLKELGLITIERSLRNCYKDSRWVTPNNNRAYSYRLEKVANYVETVKNNMPENTCQHCKKNVAEFVFREKSLCKDCYTNNNVLISIMNQTYKHNNIIEKINKIENRNVLVIPDLHLPFELEGYLAFCKDVYKKYNCNVVIFLGDIIDNHFTSFHDTDPDALGGGKELELAVLMAQNYYRAFPEALVCLGNHDRIPARKAFSGGVSNRWIRTVDEVLATPGWQYDENFILDNNLYNHGIGGEALTKLRTTLTSTVSGHFHTKSYIEYKISESGQMFFAMQLGVGCDQKKYAFAYARHHAKFHINLGVILNNGKLPIIEYMSNFRG